MTLSPLLIENIIRVALEEDLGPGMQDITSALTMPANAKAKAVMTTRTSGVVAGLAAGLSAFSILDPECEITLHTQDGDAIEAGQRLATIHGPARAIMGAERTALNIIAHLSGIATKTSQFVEAVKGTHAQIADTRKTLPGLRALQKYAVTCGGGINHRMGLYDAIMIKDNHIAIAGSIEAALRQATLLSSHTTMVEIEVDTLDQLQEVLATGGADIILLDNMNTDTLTEAVKMVNKTAITEASGNATIDIVHAIADTGVDVISIGSLTHSVVQLDIGLDIQ